MSSHHLAFGARFLSVARSISVLLWAALVVPNAICQQCTYTNCSNKSDGAYSPATSGTFIPSNFHGTGVASNVFNFTSITIPSGVTITFDGYDDNAPVYWFASGNVDIEGQLQLSGNGPTNCFNQPEARVPSVPGSGGYQGGFGSGPSPGQNAAAGSGPGGGAAGTATTNPGNGTFTGNIYLTPLVGGSGGGGNGGSNCAPGSYGEGGGAGGGAIVIVSAGQITIGGSNPSGAIVAKGGGNAHCGCGWSEGSGGAIRLVANSITGSGLLDVSQYYAGNAGFVRLEANTNSFTGTFGAGQAHAAKSLPYLVLFPTTPIQWLQITSIDGHSFVENPSSFPDVKINTNSPVPVVITAHQVPLGTVPIVSIFGDTADQQNLKCPGGLVGTLATSTCQMNIQFAPGGSRGIAITKWVLP